MKHRGFSLVELTVVMVIIGVMGSVIIPRLPTTSRPQEALAMESLESMLRQARAAAIAAGRPVQVTLGGSSGLACWGAACPSSTPVQDALGQPLSVTLGGTLSMTPPQSFTIDPQGLAPQAQDARVGSSGMVLKWDPTTGVASRVVEGAP